MDLNVFIGEGYIGTEPKIDYVGDKGTPKCFFSIGNHRGYNGNKKVNWIPCVIWGNRVEKLAPYLTKGSKVSVVGELEVRSWKDDNDNWHKVFSINCREIDFQSSNNDEKPERTQAEDSPFDVEESTAEENPKKNTEEAEAAVELDDFVDW